MVGGPQPPAGNRSSGRPTRLLPRGYLMLHLAYPVSHVPLTLKGSLLGLHVIPNAADV